jgi:hypothetical protein
MPLEPLSLRAYAAHRKRRGLLGGSLQAVQRAIQTERLKASVTRVNGLVRIADPEFADREWADNTDQTRRPPAADDEPEEGDSREGSFAYWKAKKMELDYRLVAGELVDAADVAAAIATDYSTVRTKIMGLPAKARQRLPHLTLADLATLDEIVREALEELSKGEDLPVGGFEPQRGDRGAPHSPPGAPDLATTTIQASQLADPLRSVHESTS